jgi:hypothetical protein
LTWNHVVLLGVAVSVASLWLGRGRRSASEATLLRRCRWAIRLALGYAGVLLVAVLVPLARLAWSYAVEPAAGAEERAVLLGLSLGAAVNMVLGFLIFGTVPSGVAFMLARRLPPAHGAPQ